MSKEKLNEALRAVRFSVQIDVSPQSYIFRHTHYRNKEVSLFVSDYLVMGVSRNQGKTIGWEVL